MIDYKKYGCEKCKNLWTKYYKLYFFIFPGDQLVESTCNKLITPILHNNELYGDIYPTYCNHCQKHVDVYAYKVSYEGSKRKIRYYNKFDELYIKYKNNNDLNELYQIFKKIQTLKNLKDVEKLRQKYEKNYDKLNEDIHEKIEGGYLSIPSFKEIIKLIHLNSKEKYYKHNKAKFINENERKKLIRGLDYPSFRKHL